MAEPESPFTVSEVNGAVKTALHRVPELKNIWVKGEVSNYSKGPTGHIFFNLKDPSSVLRCVYFTFRQNPNDIRKIKDGSEIQVFGSINVYEAGGSYNFNLSKVEEVGKGDILLQIEKLKARLHAEGLFDPNKKKSLPEFPVTLGIATSPTGAAVEDIIRIAKERYPNINILISPCVVQGEGAPKSIVRAIEELNRPEWKVDVIIAGRGGGSFEDLTAFNEEIVVRAFFQSRVPIISAVGHQIDSVLSDFAADYSAPTPTAAAESAVPKISEYEKFIDDVEILLINRLRERVRGGREKLTLITGRHLLSEPLGILENRSIRLDEISSRMVLLGKNYLSNKNNSLNKFDSLSMIINNYLSKKKNSFNIAETRVQNFSPLETLKRGYSVVRDTRKKLVNKISEVSAGQKLEIIVSDGRLDVEVLGIRHE